MARRGKAVKTLHPDYVWGMEEATRLEELAAIFESKQGHADDAAYWRQRAEYQRSLAQKYA